MMRLYVCEYVHINIYVCVCVCLTLDLTFGTLSGELSLVSAFQSSSVRELHCSSLQGKGLGFHGRSFSPEPCLEPVVLHQWHPVTGPYLSSVVKCYPKWRALTLLSTWKDHLVHSFLQKVLLFIWREWRMWLRQG